MNLPEARVETLESGLQTIFYNLPHHQSTSARLLIKAGSIHDEIDAPGVAHFFEHCTFNGTEEMPTPESVEDFSKQHRISKNAMTSMTGTTYIADSLDCEPVISLVTQLAMSPLLREHDMELERSAIIDEARGHQYAHGYEDMKMAAMAIGGDRYARLGTGEIQDIENISISDLKLFYERHYNLGNMILAVCSGAPIDEQREIATRLTYNSGLGERGNPVKLNLPWHRQQSPTLIHQPNLSNDAQTSITLLYPHLPARDSRHATVRNIAATVLNKAIQQKLRTDTQLSYGPSAGIQCINNTNNGLREYFGSTYLTAAVSTPDAVRALRMITGAVIAEIGNQAGEAEDMLDVLSNVSRYIAESTPSAIVNGLLNKAADGDSYDPSSSKEMAGDITTDEIIEEARILTGTNSHLIAKGPDKEVLERLKENSIV